MKEKLDRLNDIKTENIIWVIYIGIIVLSFIANNYETNYIKYNDNKSKDDYRNLMLLIFSILVIVYFRILKDSLRDVKKTSYLNNKVSKLNKLSFIGSLLVFISGVIFLYIIYNDTDIDVEIAFN